MFAGVVISYFNVALKTLPLLLNRDARYIVNPRQESCEEWSTASGNLIGPVAPSSRWHSSHGDLGAQRSHRIGDFLETRLLVKLASTGEAVQVLERGVETSLGMLGVLDAAVESAWRMELYRVLLDSEEQVEAEMGAQEQRLEVLTLMKHDMEKFAGALTPLELELVARVYDEVVSSSDVVVGKIPDWFVTDKRGWSRLDASLVVCGGASLSASGVSVEADLLAFGLVMFELIVDSLGRDDAELDAFKRQQRLPERRPYCFSEEQWNLLVGMCAHEPAERTSMIEVTHRLQSIHSQADHAIWSDDDDSGPDSQAVAHADEYRIPGTDLTIKEVLQGADKLCDEVEELIDMNRTVYNRLADVYQQLAAVADPVPLELVEDYGSVLWRFSFAWRREHKATSASWPRFVPRTLLLTTITNNARVHRWQPPWEETWQGQQEALQMCVENPGEFLHGVEDANSMAEAIALLRRIVLEMSQVHRQVELGRHLAVVSFGAVYLGKWFSTDVVVKQVLTNQSDRENSEQFFHEVNLWASFNHDNLIKLYGACHEGQPCFVCERADGGTLVKYTQGRSQFPAWRAIWEAVKGLQYLHERGIVHGDLKGNNILVCDATAKLADFGLSALRVLPMPQELWVPFAGKHPSVWRVPDRRSRRTFSPFPSVVFNVLHKRMLPPRPNDFSDAQRDLITRMGSFEPQHMSLFSSRQHGVSSFCNLPGKISSSGEKNMWLETSINSKKRGDRQVHRLAALYA
ncbi:hypothetical protein PHYPSEUDO_009120 [Phytophthora pseudosyringae]|uniref:Protein kinase domain-containing protein n=1 Tax=Phytophthora pseudosyringae TaxID=221518 RepID=A0A8T1VI04_9STRA|nr:hypothetical protein PHYPSEUDO_009120 [Phytophthora pseudosyringae]